MRGVIQRLLNIERTEITEEKGFDSCALWRTAVDPDGLSRRERRSYGNVVPFETR